jgi:hypothetical protein
VRGRGASDRADRPLRGAPDAWARAVDRFAIPPRRELSRSSAHDGKRSASPRQGRRKFVRNGKRHAWRGPRESSAIVAGPSGLSVASTRAATSPMCGFRRGAELHCSGALSKYARFRISREALFQHFANDSIGSETRCPMCQCCCCTTAALAHFRFGHCVRTCRNRASS